MRILDDKQSASIKENLIMGSRVCKCAKPREDDARVFESYAN